MDSAFLDAFRSAVDSGDFRGMAALYAADARFEGFLPGGVREAVGPAAIAALLADVNPSTPMTWARVVAHAP